MTRTARWARWTVFPVAMLFGWASGFAARCAVVTDAPPAVHRGVDLHADGGETAQPCAATTDRATEPERVSVPETARPAVLAEKTEEIDRLTRHLEHLRAFARVNRFKVDAGLTEKRLRSHFQRSVLLRSREDLEQTLQTMSAPDVLALWEAERDVLRNLHQSIATQEDETRDGARLDALWPKARQELTEALAGRNAPSTLFLNLDRADPMFVLEATRMADPSGLKDAAAKAR